MTVIAPRTLGFQHGYHTYKVRYPRESELQILRRMDARILPLFMSTIEDPPLAPLTTKHLLIGLVDFMIAMDDRLETLDHPEFKQHDRIIGAKNFFAREGIDVSDVLVPHPGLDDKNALEFLTSTRASLWERIPT